MFIVTTAVDGQRLGCLVGFATQASIDPPRFVVCLSHTNHTYRHGRDAGWLAVHAVPADAEALAELFGGETEDDVDKFERCAWHEGPHGMPLLDECGNWFVGRVLHARRRRRPRRVPARAGGRRGGAAGRLHLPPREAHRPGA